MLTRYTLGTLVAALLSFTACGTPMNEDGSQSGQYASSEEALIITRPMINRFFGTSTSDVWGVGRGSLTLHWDGKVWRRFPNPGSTELRAIWGSASNNVWAVGDSASIIRWNGTAWSRVSPASIPTTTGLNDIWGTSANDIWAVGDSGTILHYNGTSWAQVTTPYINSFVTVWAAASTDVWVGGEYGILLRWDGTVFSEVASPVINTFWRIRGTSTSSAWMTTYDNVGSSYPYPYGNVYRWNGLSWSTPLPGPNGPELAVDTDTNVWTAGGSSSTYVSRWNGSTWTSNNFGSTNVTALWVSGTDGWLVDSSGTVRRLIGGSWSYSW